ncbi:hypothetical protein COP2_025288 [Malus domestica]
MKKLKLKEYKIDLKEYGHMVLESLIKIKNEMDPTFTFWRSCWEMICDSCAMNIDGCNGLACLTKIVSSEAGTSMIMSLPHMFVIKDLLYKSIEPWLKQKSPATELDGKEIKQSKKDRAKLDGMYKCILCDCCSISCLSYWWNPESYLGPAALLHANRRCVEADRFPNLINSGVSIEYLGHMPINIRSSILMPLRCFTSSSNLAPTRRIMLLFG